MSKYIEIPKYDYSALRAGAAAKRWLKRMIRRARRRREREHPEDVPVHLTKGWYW